MSQDDYGAHNSEPLSPAGGASMIKEPTTKKSKGIAAMSSKVLETWINETLADAEHLDIPGVLLKPEHKNPIARYGVDRLTLT